MYIDDNTWIIILVLCLITITSIAIGCVYFVIRGRKGKFSHLLYQLKFEGNSDEIDLNSDLKDQVQNLPYNTKREIKRSAFELKDEIGSGNFGKVDKGVLKGLCTDSPETTVAIKSTHDFGNEQNMFDLVCEIKLMSRIKPHPNLVSMIGSCSSELAKDGKLWLLIEYCEYGDLKSYLESNKTAITYGGSEA